MSHQKLPPLEHFPVTNILKFPRLQFISHKLHFKCFLSTRRHSWTLAESRKQPRLSSSTLIKKFLDGLFPGKITTVITLIHFFCCCQFQKVTFLTLFPDSRDVVSLKPAASYIVTLPSNQKRGLKTLEFSGLPSPS